jgi:tRNA 2-selenouridine synthase
MRFEGGPDATGKVHGATRRHANVADLAKTGTIIDARTPAEFALDHIPGAINCPVLTDEERVVVGTLYKQRGAFEARRVGGAMVAANLALHLKTVFADKPADWKPVVYCWRGGLRSGSMVQWLRLVGWDARQLAGGYKSFRRHVIELIDTMSPRLDLRILCGPTGSAKTRVLQALATIGQQTIDLEAFAAHKGSVLGHVPGIEQPTQKQFETRLATALEALDPSRPVYVEAESRKIGRIALPTPFLERMRASPCIEIVASHRTRLDYLLRDYAYLGDEPEGLAAKIAQLHGLQSNETLTRWREWARSRALAPLFEELMRDHYDPLYARSQHGNFLRLRDAVRVDVVRLDDDDMTAIAALVVAVDTTLSLVHDSSPTS